MSDFDEVNYGKCVLMQECKTPKCGNDTYILPGYAENGRRGQFDAMWFDSDNRRKFECHLPFSRCKYDIPCILDNLHREVTKHSGSKPVDLVGMSFGGMLIEAYTYEHPERVDKLGLITSFSDLREWYIGLRRRLDPEYTENIEKYDSKKVVRNRPKKKVFEYNCVIDGVIGNPPNFVAIPQKTRDYLKEFIEDFDFYP